MSDEYETENYLDANGKRWVWIDHVNQIVGRLERELATLKAENERLREALGMFNPWRIGYGESLSHASLRAAWDNAVKALAAQEDK